MDHKQRKKLLEKGKEKPELIQIVIEDLEEENKNQTAMLIVICIIISLLIGNLLPSIF